MPSTKTLRTIIAAGETNAAGATETGTVVNLTTAYGGLLTIKITNGGTGPTVPASAYVYTSGDNTNFKTFTTVTHVTTNSAVGEWAIDIPPAVMYLRVDVKDNTGQSVTCEAFLQELTTV
jgi:hypothetical protein